MTVSFLVVNFFTADLVRDLIASIKKHITLYEIDILIADNSLNEAQQVKLSSFTDSTVRVFECSSNLGFVGANNFLYKEARGELLVLINPDTLLIDNSLEHLLEYVEGHHDVGVAGPKLLNADLSHQVSSFHFPDMSSLIKEHLLLYRKNVYAYDPESPVMMECDVVKGACLVMRREVAQIVDLFDKDLTMYSEETDLCYRIRRNGLKVIYFPEAKIIHYGEASSAKKEYSEYSLYHYYRSKLVFFRKNYRRTYFLLVKLILLSSLVEHGIVLFLVNKRRSSDLYFGVLKKIVSGNL